MKKYILFPVTMVAGIFASTQLLAQEPPSKEKKSEEIIIRKNGGQNQKMTVEVNGDSVLVNGKPLSEFHDGDISVIENDDLENGNNNFAFAPRNHGFDKLRLISDEKPHTFLGVLSEKADNGVKISEVVKGSAAEKSGLLKGDIVTKIDDKTITTPDDLMKIVRSYKPGDEIKLYYVREGKKKDVKLKLGETKSNNPTFIYKNINPDWNANAFNLRTPQMPDAFTGPDNLYKNFNFNFRYDKPRMGLKIQDMENGDGVKILNVQEGSVADKAGLKKDDVITEVNGEKIKGVEDAMEQMGDLDEGETVKIKALRNNSEMNFEVKIPKKLNQANL
ncbi:MAG TPA: PDZ domain-containing protein [Chitinophagaceae bacterium]|nr:PDZ domain-containing protein [Chitinophagaceae bacterium]